MPERPARRSLAATALTQYVRLDNCERYLHLQLHPRETAARLKAMGVTAQPLTPLLADAGARFETGAVARLAAAGYRVLDLSGTQPGATVRAIAAARQGERLVLYQASVAGQMGEWPCHGNADLIRVRRREDGTLDLLAADIKASKQDRLEHRLQVTFYAVALEQMAAAAGERVAALAGLVVHREHQEGPLDLEALPHFDLAPYRLALEHLVSDPDAVATRAADAPLEAMPYHLSYKCDGCLFNGFCLQDTAQRRDLSLIPLLSGAEKRILQAEGIATVEQLAALKQLPPPGHRGPLPVAPGQEETVARLANRWRVGANLDLLSQRARAFARRADPDVPALPFLWGTGAGSLPADPSDGLPFVKIFADVQHDYLQDRVYLVGALIAGPGGAFNIVEMTEDRPDDAAEAAMLRAWAPQVFAAVAQAAGAPSAHLHIYLYDQYDQRLLLEALRRHASDLNMTALFDLLTAAPGADHPGEPGLAQPMLSFLAQEVAERRNPALTCQPLHDVARELGFDWTYRVEESDSSDNGAAAQQPSDPKSEAPIPTSAALSVPSERNRTGKPGIEYWRIFRARMFDNRRTITLNGRPVSIESAARFNSQLPLEYPYAAWGKLPAPKDGAERRLLAPFLPVTRALIRGFMAHRLRALRHIEGRLGPKNGRLGKRPLNLAALAFQALGRVSLARAVEEFLFIEHHTKLQALLLDWSRPVEERARRGQAMVLECQWCEVGERGALRAGFRLCCDLVGMDPALALRQLALKEGDWVVVNREEDDQRPRKMLHGRLGIIQRMTEGKDGPEAVIELLSLSFPGGKFRYSHDTALQPAPGDLLIVDPMGDDLNADKFLSACRAASSGATPNPLLAAIAAGAERNGLPVPAERARQMAAALAAVQAASPAPLTLKQQEVIAGGLDQRVRLVQGPPGTGKSHTLGWAVPAQMAAARQAGQPHFRVAVTAKTHTAVNIALASIRDKAAALHRAGGPLAAALDGLRIVKLGGDADDGNAPRGIEPFSVYQPAGGLRALAEAPLVVAGGTPGGLYNLLSRGYGPQSMWAARPFDLLVADEASQMNLPEAVTAAAFVKPEGRLLIVGDHRQMAPIVAHNWDEEERRSVKDAEIYRSLFEYLLDRGFPSSALDRSFRLHRDLAAFLAEIIYRQDGVDLHSERSDRLPPIASEDPLVRAALDPAYPVVVIEHDEASSQQYNTFEAEIVARLLAALTGRNGPAFDGAQGVGVVAPHRAQRALLQARFPELAAAGAIDTVERFQGGEREVIIVSATASDPDFVLGEAEFLLDPNRLNVALSRPRRKLIVVAARTVFRLICADLEVFEHATLWKRLRYGFTDASLWEGEVGGVGVRVLGRRAEE